MFTHIFLVEVSLQLVLLPIWLLASFVQCCQQQSYTMNKLKIFHINHNPAYMKEQPDLENHLPKSLFSGSTGFYGIIVRSSKMISEIWPTLSLNVNSNRTKGSFCLLPYFEAKQSRVCSHFATEKRAKTKTSARPGLPLSQIKSLYTGHFPYSCYKTYATSTNSNVFIPSFLLF